MLVIDYKPDLDLLFLFQSIKYSLVNSGCVLLKNFEDNKDGELLVKLISFLGNISSNDVVVSDRHLKNLVHKVEVQEKPIKDSNGFLILSTTSLEFPCHTDGYFEPNPVDIVILQCVRQAEVGGDSILVFIDNLISHLDLDTIEYLKKSIFPNYFGEVSILREDKTGFYIRYNRLELERSAQARDLLLSKKKLEVLDKVDEAIKASKIILKLNPNDCLLINNKKILHGRTEILSNKSNRLFKRVQLYW